MAHPSTTLRFGRALGMILGIILLSTGIDRAEAATTDALLRLRPHCEAILQEECAAYAARDPVTLQTPPIVPGSILDMDVVIDNPSGQPITRVRAWMSYDPVIFEGKRIEPNAKFPIITPGEADFSTMLGYIQIGLQTEGGISVTDRIVPVARIQLLVKEAPSGGKTVIAFYDVLPDPTGHTAVVILEGAAEANILSSNLGSLLVQFPTEAAAGSSSSSSAVSAAPTSPESSVASVGISSSAAAMSQSSVPAVAPSEGEAGGTETSFSLLQVQNLRVTTEGSTVYLAWDALPSSTLAGYNIYYGADSGRYLQRRGIAKEATSTAIRALPLDATYYFAVRAVSAENEESAFSQEVAIQVGNPKTSTAPLAMGLIDKGPEGRNPLEQPKVPPATSVPGDTGIPTPILLLFIASGVIGTAFAFRRQFTASIRPHP